MPWSRSPLKRFAGPTYWLVRPYAGARRKSTARLSEEPVPYVRPPARSSIAWSRCSDRSRASREPLEGGITNRNYRATFAGSEHVIRLPGRDTELLGIDRAAEGAAASAAAELGIAPPVTALLEDPPCLVCAFVPGRQVDRGGPARAGAAGAPGADPGRAARARAPGGRAVLGLPGGRGLRGHRARARRRGCRTTTSRPTRAPADRGGVRRGRRARPRAVPQRPAGRQPAGGWRGHPDRGLGVRRAWATAGSTWATWP